MLSFCYKEVASDDDDFTDGLAGLVAMFYFSNGGKTVEVRYWSTVQNAFIKADNAYSFTINTIPRQN